MSNKLKIGAKARSLVQYQGGEGEYFFVGETKVPMKSGYYTVNTANNQIYLAEQHINTDEWLDFRDGMIVDLLKEMDVFWNKKDVFEAYGFLQRRGYLLYGPPGSGKSVLLKQVMCKTIENGGIIINGFVHPSLLINAINNIRQVEPDRNIIVIMEDIDTIIATFGEAAILSYLDGEDSNNYILNIATTNYIDRLDRRITKRPRRFDRIVKIAEPDAEMRRYFFVKKLNLSEEEVEEWVKVSKGFSFAGLSELVISVKCLGHSLVDTAIRLKDMFNIGSDDEPQTPVYVKKFSYNGVNYTMTADKLPNAEELDAYESLDNENNAAILKPLLYTSAPENLAFPKVDCGDCEQYMSLTTGHTGIVANALGSN